MYGGCEMASQRWRQCRYEGGGLDDFVVEKNDLLFCSATVGFIVVQRAGRCVLVYARLNLSATFPMTAGAFQENAGKCKL